MHVKKRLGKKNLKWSLNVQPLLVGKQDGWEKISEDLTQGIEVTPRYEVLRLPLTKEVLPYKKILK